MEHGHHLAHENAQAYGSHHSDDLPGLPFDPQDMRFMGGLKERMPRTYRAYLIGMLALAGVFPFAGFWSKDEILADALRVGFLDGRLEGYIAFGLLLVSALFTAFYMGRQVYMIFHGEPRTEAAKYAGERGGGMGVMVNVLTVLAIGAALIGLINVPAGFWVVDQIVPNHALTGFLAHTVVYAHAGTASMLLAFIAVFGALAMIYLARILYRKQAVVRGTHDPLEANPQTAGIFALANARLYWDETYDRYLEQPFNRAAVWLGDRLDWAFLHDFVHDVLIRDVYNGISRALSTPVDLGLIDGAVNGLGRLVRWLGGAGRRLQTGYVRVYALSVLLGALLVVVLLVAPLLQQALGG